MRTLLAFVFSLISLFSMAEDSKILRGDFEITRELSAIYINEKDGMLPLDRGVLLTLSQAEVNDSTTLVNITITAGEKPLYGKTFKDVTVLKSTSKEEQYGGRYAYCVLSDDFIFLILYYYAEIDGYVAVMSAIEL